MNIKLSYTFKRFSNTNSITELIPYLKNDKKNEDDKINFILLKRLGQTTRTNQNKISENDLRRYSKIISQY